uniref:Potassium channel domain-containing protein n=1 Tax=Anopheles farauti TaxID=69004 RepID=A0A182QQG7_9DIPT
MLVAYLQGSLASTMEAPGGSGAVPVVARRRRRVARQLRESTPDPTRDGSVGSRSNSCDDQSGSESARGRSTVESSPSSSKKSLIERAIEYGSSHRNKILARKDKKLSSVVAPRSRSVPRDEGDVPSSPEIFSLLRRAKRSLSAARKPKTDDSSDGGRISDTEVRKRRERIERFQSERSRESTDAKTGGPLQANLQRFNEERRKFELEKLKFLQEKRELDRMRLRRFEKYREEMLEEQSRKLKAKLQEERSKSIEATPLPPLAPSVAHRSRTPTRTADPMSPSVGKKKVLIVPKARSSSRSASTSEDEGRLSSDEEKKQTIRRRFSPRKPKRPRSVKLEPSVRRPQPRPDHGITSPESELPSDYQPEEAENRPHRQDSPEAKEKEPEMVLTHRKVTVPKEATETEKPEEHEPRKESLEKDTNNEAGKETNGIVAVEQADDKAHGKEDGLKTRQRRRPLALYVERPGDVFSWRELTKEWYEMWQDFLDDQPDEIVRMRVQVNHCLFYFAVMVLLCGIGGIAFRLTEGTFESQYKCGVKRVKREFIDQLWLSSHSQREEDWKLTARNRLRKFEEELQIAFEAGMKTYSGNTAWNFVNGVIYSLTVVSTIGYGHISPSTTTGRALTILYAIIGIPIFLIVLADFGKLFTRGIKFMWAYVRRLYYTGSFRKVRKTAQVQEVMKGLNVVYDMVRRPSTDNELQGATTTTAVPVVVPPPQQPPQPASVAYRAPVEAQAGASTAIETMPDTPTTPVPETFEIDDEFNLPISVAIVILVAYMLFGANIYCTWENWSFFEAFYFVFISISTIGFGDYVPQHPIYMMCSILYLIFGLALTSMCINVVQLKLSDSFKQASAKIGATIGLQMAEAASQHQQSPVHTPIELAAVHTSTPTSAVNASLSEQTPTLPTRPSSSVPKPETKE